MFTCAKQVVANGKTSVERLFARRLKYANNLPPLRTQPAYLRSSPADCLAPTPCAYVYMHTGCSKVVVNYAPLLPPNCVAPFINPLLQFISPRWRKASANFVSQDTLIVTYDSHSRLRILNRLFRAGPLIFGHPVRTHLQCEVRRITF